MPKVCCINPSVKSKGQKMAGTFSKIYYHIVFSTKGRANFITKPIRDELYKYICGIIKNEQGFVYSIGGMEDHIHLLCSLPTTKSISEMMKRIKGHSSKWVCSKSDTLSTMLTLKNNTSGSNTAYLRHACIYTFNMD